MTDYSRSVRWLLQSEDPSIRYITLRDVAGANIDSAEVISAKSGIPDGPKVKALLSGLGGTGRDEVHPYRKWTGDHWRLVSLVNLEVPLHTARVSEAAHRTLGWLYKALSNRNLARKNGLARMHASVYGNGLGVWSRLGLAHDPRVEFVARRVISAQWPDGGWNCDPDPRAYHSSFHESLATLWGLTEYQKATGSGEAAESVRKASELFLSHRIFRSHTTGEIARKEWLKLRYPVYWHFNFLEAMRILSLAGHGNDERMSQSLDLLESKCNPDGMWEVEGCFWRPLDNGSLDLRGPRGSTEVVDWGRRGPNEMITLNALRALKSAGRLRTHFSEFS